MFPNGGHGHQPAPAPAPGPGQLPLGQGLGPNVGHHLGHTISPMGPPSSGNQLPGEEGELDVISSNTLLQSRNGQVCSEHWAKVWGSAWVWVWAR